MCRLVVYNSSRTAIFKLDGPFNSSNRSGRTILELLIRKLLPELTQTAVFIIFSQFFIYPDVYAPCHGYMNWPDIALSNILGCQPAATLFHRNIAIGAHQARLINEVKVISRISYAVLFIQNLCLAVTEMVLPSCSFLECGAMQVREH
jgi:hypothetical protein